eukprot:1497238-Lingulodinium_polyedra.AAC.1
MQTRWAGFAQAEADVRVAFGVPQASQQERYEQAAPQAQPRSRQTSIVPPTPAPFLVARRRSL